MLGTAVSRPAASRRLTPLDSLAAGFRPLTITLIAAVLAETLLLRIVVRVGVHVPKHHVFAGLFETASTLGSLAFNFASVLALVTLTLVLTFAIASERSSMPRSRSEYKGLRWASSSVARSASIGARSEGGVLPALAA